MSLFWMYTTVQQHYNNYWLYLFLEVFSQLCIICCWENCVPRNCSYPTTLRFPCVRRRVMSGKPREISSRAQVLKAWKKRKLSAWRRVAGSSWFEFRGCALVGKFQDEKLGGHDSLYKFKRKFCSNNLFRRYSSYWVSSPARVPCKKNRVEMRSQYESYLFTHRGEWSSQQNQLRFHNLHWERVQYIFEYRIYTMPRKLSHWSSSSTCSTHKKTLLS